MMNRIKNMDRQHLLGYAFVVIAVLMVIQGVWLQYDQDRETQCQSDYNAQNSVVVAQRAQWADEDRKALNQMIFTVINPKVDQSAREDAVQEYAVTAKKNDANRKANPLPTRTKCG